jgi:predicted nucleic acid-binding protein
MATERLFLDTSYVVALLNRKDQCHAKAVGLQLRLDQAEVWVTEVVLIEIGDTLGGWNRRAAFEFIEQCYQTTNMKVVSHDTALVRQALQLFASRMDKDWGLTDCISFVVMKDHGLTDALTADRHFIQAGFRALMSEEP